MRPATAEKLLKWLLIVLGGMAATAVVPMVMPFAWICREIVQPPDAVIPGRAQPHRLPRTHEHDSMAEDLERNGLVRAIGHLVGIAQVREQGSGTQAYGKSWKWAMMLGLRCWAASKAPRVTSIMLSRPPLTMAAVRVSSGPYQTQMSFSG